MAVDTYGEKGDCTLRGVVKIYPGSNFTHDQSDFGAPAGWRMKACSPNTPNSKNSYQRTTGWTFSFEGSGGGDSDGPKGEVKAGISYSTSDVYSTEFNDFEVVNESSSLYGSWDYRFELLYNNWKDAFTGVVDIDVKPLPKLSYSRLPLNNEVIYEIDRNINGYQRINFFIQHSTAFLYSYFWSGYGYKVNSGEKNEGKGFRWEMVNINLGLVSF